MASYPYFDNDLRLWYAYDKNRKLIHYQDGKSRQGPINSDPSHSVNVPRSYGRPARSGSQSVGAAPVSATPSNRENSYTHGTMPSTVSNWASAQQGSASRPSAETTSRSQTVQDLSGSMNTLTLNAPGPSTVPRAGSVSNGDQFQPRHYQTQNGLHVIETFNPDSEVRTTIATEKLNGSERITESTLLQQGVRARGLLIGHGREGEPEKLFSTFKVRHHGFFVVGRVFLVLWVEPAGTTTVTNVEKDDAFIPGRYQDEFIYSKVRRFVVIRAGKEYCSAIPIASYGNRGVGKRGVNKSEHAIIYTGNCAPTPLPTEAPVRGEDGMRHTAIRVITDDPTDKLDSVSRLDFGKVHTIQHDIKVKPFGMVHQASLPALGTQFMNAWCGDAVAAAMMRSTTVVGSGGAPLATLREEPPPLNASILPVVSTPPVSTARAPGFSRYQASTPSRTGVTSAYGSLSATRTAPLQDSRSQDPQAASLVGIPSAASAHSRGRPQPSVSQESDEDTDEEEDVLGFVATRSVQQPWAQPIPRASQSEPVRSSNMPSQAGPASLGSQDYAASIATEAWSAQSAFQGLRQQGYTAGMAFEIMVQRYMEARPGVSRDSAASSIRRRLRYHE